MALTIIEGEKYARPVFICDYCEKEIDDAESGNYLWQNGPNKITDIKFLHKKCTRDYEKNIQRMDFSIGINFLLIYLLNNTGMTEEKLQKGLELAKQLSAI